MGIASDLLRIPTWNAVGALHVVVESPKGCALKLKYDPELAAFTVVRPLLNGLCYPYDWGFIPRTRNQDGDPLDAMVLSSVPSAPGVVWACEPIGLVQLSQPGPDRGHRIQNDRVLAVPRRDPRAEQLRETGSLTERERAELAQFFLAAVVLDKPGVELGDWQGPEAARQAIRSYAVD
jgi:inorganic pyrophosphatase